MVWEMYFRGDKLPWGGGKKEKSVFIILLKMMTTIAIKSDVEIGKSIFDDLDQMVMYLLKKKLVSPVEVGFVSRNEINSDVVELHEKRIKGGDFIDVTNI